MKRCDACRLEHALREDALQLGAQLSGESRIDVAIAFSERALRDLAARGLRAVTLSIQTPSIDGPVKIDVAIAGIDAGPCAACGTP